MKPTAEDIAREAVWGRIGIFDTELAEKAIEVIAALLKAEGEAREAEIETWLERPEGHTLPRRDGPWMTIIEPKQGQAIADALRRGDFRPARPETDT